MPDRDPNLYKRRTVYAVVALLAAWAFVVSYSHIYDLARAHAQHGIAAKGTPLTVDLLIVASSLVLWMQKQEDDRPGGLARFLPRLMLWAGIGATIGANVAYGLPHGWLSGVMSAWPGVVFAGVVEMVLVTARPGAREADKRTVMPPAQPVVPGSSHEAARAAYAASVAGGNKLTEYQLHKRYGIARSQARKICTVLAPMDAAVAVPPSPGASGGPPRPPVTASANGQVHDG